MPVAFTMRKLSKLLSNRRTPKGFIEEANFLDRLSEVKKRNSLRSHRYTADDKYFEAIKLGNAEKVQKHIYYGYHDVNYKDWKQRTLLHFTCAYDQLEILDILLKNNCDIDAYDKNFTTALSVAVQCGHIQCAALLLEHGANLHLMDQSGNNPLHYAVCDGQQKVVELLLQYHADIEEKTAKHGLTPLLLALREKRVDMAQFLITKGANIFAVDNQKRNSLMYAVRCDSEYIVKLLLHKGIDIYCQDEFGWTALRYAIEGQCNVREMLSEYAKTNCEPVEDGSTEHIYFEEESVHSFSQNSILGTFLDAYDADECNSDIEIIYESVSVEDAGSLSEIEEEQDRNKLKEKVEEHETLPVMKSVFEEKESVPNEAEGGSETQEFIFESKEDTSMKSAIEEKASIPNEEIEITWVQPFIQDEVSETEKYIAESDLEIESLEENMSDDSGKKQQAVCDSAGAESETGHLNINEQTEDELPGKLTLEEEQNRLGGSEHVQEDIFKGPQPLKIGFVPMDKNKRINIKDYMKDTPDTDFHWKETTAKKDSASREASAVQESKRTYTETSENYSPWKVSSERNVTLSNEAAPMEDIQSLYLDEQPVKLTPEQFQTRMRDIQRQRRQFHGKGTFPLLMREVAVATDLTGTKVLQHRGKETSEAAAQWKHMQELLESKGSGTSEATEAKNVKLLYKDTLDTYHQCEATMDSEDTLHWEASGRKDVNSCYTDTPDEYCQHKETKKQAHTIQKEASAREDMRPHDTDSSDEYCQEEATNEQEHALQREASARKDVRPHNTDTPYEYHQHKAAKEQDHTVQSEASPSKDVRPWNTDSGISPNNQSFPNSNKMLLEQNCLQQVTERIENMENRINDLQKNIADTKEVAQELKELLKKPGKVCSLCNSHAREQVQIQVKRCKPLCHHQKLKERFCESEEQYNRETAVKQHETPLGIIDMELIDLNQELSKKHNLIPRRISPKEEHRTLPDQILAFRLHIRKHTDILQEKIMSELQDMDDEMKSSVCHMKKMKHLSKKTKSQNSRLEDIVEKQAETIKMLKNHLSKMSEELSRRASLATAEEIWEELYEEKSTGNEN